MKKLYLGIVGAVTLSAAVLVLNTPPATAQQTPQPGIDPLAWLHQNYSLELTASKSEFVWGPSDNATGTSNTVLGQYCIASATNSLVVGYGSSDGAYTGVDVFGQNVTAAVANTTYIGTATNNVTLSGYLNVVNPTNIATAAVAWGGAGGTNGYTNLTKLMQVFYLRATNGPVTLSAGLPGTNVIIAAAGAGPGAAVQTLIPYFVPPGGTLQNSSNITGVVCPLGL